MLSCHKAQQHIGRIRTYGLQNMLGNGSLRLIWCVQKKKAEKLAEDRQAQCCPFCKLCTFDDWTTIKSMQCVFYRTIEMDTNKPEKSLVPFSKWRMLLYKLLISSWRSFMFFFRLPPARAELVDKKAALTTSWYILLNGLAKKVCRFSHFVEKQQTQGLFHTKMNVLYENLVR